MVDIVEIVDTVDRSVYSAGMPEIDHYLTVSQVAEDLGVGTSAVYKLIERGQLKATRRSAKNIRISPGAFEAYKRHFVRKEPFPAVNLVQQDLEEVAERFRSSTGSQPDLWLAAWKQGRLEDSAENMERAIEAIALVLARRASDEMPNSSLRSRNLSVAGFMTT